MAKWTTTDIPDQSRRVAVVTGANTGLGYETAAALAEHGAHVVLAVRNLDKGKDAVSRITANSPQADVALQELDLTSLESVRAAAEQLRSDYDRIDLLINNAGVMWTPKSTTKDGFELQFGTNHLGHFVLTNLVMPALVAGAPSRVVNLSSGGHRSSDILWDDPNFARTPYDKMTSYGQSKTANILFSVELDRRMADRGVRAYAVHPGVIQTELSRYMTPEDLTGMLERMKAMGREMPPYKTPEGGAATSLWAATAPELENIGGVYLEDCHVSQAMPYATDPEAAVRLWALTEELLGQQFPL